MLVLEEVRGHRHILWPILIDILLPFFVYSIHPEASSYYLIIIVAQHQKVVSSGPYGMVRHLLYFGGIDFI